MLIIEYLDDSDTLHIEPFESLTQEHNITKHRINGNLVSPEQWQRTQQSVYQLAMSTDVNFPRLAYCRDLQIA